MEPPALFGTSVFATLGAVLGVALASWLEKVDEVGWKQAAHLGGLFVLVYLLDLVLQKLARRYPSVFPGQADSESGRRDWRITAASAAMILIAYLGEELLGSQMEDGALFIGFGVLSLLCGGISYAWLYASHRYPGGAAYAGAVYGALGGLLIMHLLILVDNGEHEVVADFYSLGMDTVERLTRPQLSSMTLIYGGMWSLTGLIGGIFVDLRPRLWVLWTCIAIPFWSCLVLIAVFKVLGVPAEVDRSELVGDGSRALGWIAFFALALGGDRPCKRAPLERKSYLLRSGASLVVLSGLVVMAFWWLHKLVQEGRP